MKICKICFKNFRNISIFDIFSNNCYLCQSCKKKLDLKWKNFTINKVDGLALYDYDENIQELLFKFKGCYDYELKDVFLSQVAPILKVLYKGYYIIPIPSFKTDDFKREFNHVVEAFKCLNLQYIFKLRKNEKIKQSSNKKSKRIEIKNYLELVDDNSLKDKKILIVDDVYTTGSTLHAAIELIKKCNPKKIKVLVIAKTVHDAGPT